MSPEAGGAPARRGWAHDASTSVDPALVEWLRADHGPGLTAEPEPPRPELRCDPLLVARLTEIARAFARTRRLFVAGCPVIHHPRGRPIAAAAGADWFVARSSLGAGALASPTPAATSVGPGWVELDPWAPDTAFARAIDLLRAQVARAYDAADAPS